MKVFILLIFSLVATTAIVYGEGKPIAAQQLQTINASTLSPFLKALKEGDVAIIKECISGDFYESRKVLLEQNEDYPEFLRGIYRNAKFKLISAVEDNDEIVIEIMTEFQNGTTSLDKIRLSAGKDKRFRIHKKDQN